MPREQHHVHFLAAAHCRSMRATKATTCSRRRRPPAPRLRRKPMSKSSTEQLAKKLPEAQVNSDSEGSRSYTVGVRRKANNRARDMGRAEKSGSSNPCLAAGCRVGSQFH